MSGRRNVKLGTLLLLSTLALAAGAAEPEPLGRVHDVGASTELPIGPGRQLVSGELLRAMNEGALVRLDNGQLLRLDPNSAVLLDGGPEGEVRVRVLSGSVTTLDGEGRPLVGGARSTFTLPPIVQDGEAVERDLLELEQVRTGRGEEEPAAAARAERVRLSR